MVTVELWGFSEFFQIPIIAYRFTNSTIPLNSESLLENVISSEIKKKKVFILGGVHGDEIEGVAAADFLIGTFLQNYNLQLDLTIVPRMNPDGVLLGHRTNGRGIDLNRNLPTLDWSSEIKNPRYPPGPSANSEKESQILVNSIEKEKPELIISLHSWKPLLNVNGDCNEEAEAISNVNHYIIDRELSDHPTPGCLGTYGIEKGIAVLTYEIERGMNIKQIHSVHTMAILKALRIRQDKK